MKRGAGRAHQGISCGFGSTHGTGLTLVAVRLLRGALCRLVIATQLWRTVVVVVAQVAILMFVLQLPSYSFVDKYCAVVALGGEGQ